jgi:hypothetical protein
MTWMPAFDPLAAVSLLVLATVVIAAPRLITGIRHPATLAVTLYALALALGLSLNLARDGTHGWASVFATGHHGSVEGGFEYLPGLPWLGSGVNYYVSHFAPLFPYLTTHVKGNPPGPLVALHLLGIHTAGALAALCILLGALTAPLAYDLGRVIGDEQRGRIAGLLTAFSPSVLLFGVTSTDYGYATLGLGAACLLARRRRSATVLGSLLVGFGAFFSWLLLAIPAWAALFALRREGVRPAARLGAVSAAGVAAVTAVLALTLGYDPFSALRATGQAYSHGISSTRPYWFWLVGSPAAFAAMLGLPITWLALRSLALRDEAAIAIAGLIAIASVLGFTKAETERIWLAFVPLACVAAASSLPPRLLRPVLVALAAQALAVEALFFTVW